MKDVVILTGSGQSGMAIARRIVYGKKIVIGDKFDLHYLLASTFFWKCELQASVPGGFD